LQIRSPDERRTPITHEVRQNEEGVDIASRFILSPLLRSDDVVLIDQSRIAVDKSDPIAPFLHHGDLLLDLARMPDIVSIDRRNELAVRVCDSQIAGSCHSYIRLSQEDDQWILATESLDYSCGVVVGPVIDNNDLEVGIGFYRCMSTFQNERL
jgi:hypothetical protein